MAVPLRLEVFETADAPEEPSLLMPEDLDELRLAAYERGYAAGFEDAGAQAATEEAARRARVATAVEALNFGYHEARAELLAGLEPVLRAMLDPLLPGVARGMIVPQVIDLLLPLARAPLDGPLTLSVASGMVPAFNEAFEGLVLPPLAFDEREDLGPCQAEIRTATDEIRIDLDAVLERLGEALSGFHHHATEEVRRA